MNEIKITVSGNVGVGKSAVCGEIEILCKALGLEVEWVEGNAEKNYSGADWTAQLEMYKPSVRIIEAIDATAPSLTTAAGAVLTPEWLWLEFMDYCKEVGRAPADMNRLFEIVSRARIKLSD